MECMLNTLLRRCKPHQIFRTKQTVYLAASNTDTIVDSAVTAVYTRGGQTDSTYEPRIVKPKLQRAAT